MKKVVIVDYGVGNIFSIKQALKESGCEALVSSRSEDLEGADGILLPGVGAFGDAISKLKERNLVQILRQQAQQGKPFLGVCLGLQLLFSKSEEFGNHEGLDILSGTVKRFPATFENTSLKVPFIGWNFLKHLKEDPFTAGLSETAKMFLVHSYYVQPEDATTVLSSCSYHGFEYPVVLRKGNVFGVQGHPEKSGQDGLKVYSNWLNSL